MLAKIFTSKWYRFAANPEYLFFAQFIIEQKKVKDSINIALKKNAWTAVYCFSSKIILLIIFKLYKISFVKIRIIYFSDKFQERHLNYWQNFMYEVIAMEKQLNWNTNKVYDIILC